MDLSCGKCNVISLYFMCFSIIIIIIIFIRMNNYMVHGAYKAFNNKLLIILKQNKYQVSHNPSNTLHNKIERNQVHITANILILYISIQ